MEQFQTTLKKIPGEGYIADFLTSNNDLSGRMLQHPLYLLVFVLVF